MLCRLLLSEASTLAVEGETWLVTGGAAVPLPIFQPVTLHLSCGVTDEPSAAPHCGLKDSVSGDAESQEVRPAGWGVFGEGWHFSAPGGNGGGPAAKGPAKIPAFS